MPPRRITLAKTAHSFGPSFHTALLASVSAIALLMASGPASGRPFAQTSGAGLATANAAAAALASAQQAQAVGAQMTSDLLRAAQAVQAVQQAQVAARTAAQQTSASVPNGLVAGGLVVDPRVAAGSDPNLWQNISAPSQTTSNGQTIVTLTQSAQRAIATWEQFNVGKNTVVDFNQSGGNSTNGNNWVVLNRIDATGVPSQIQGQINAQGTVLIINPNGIVFSGTSQINIHTLIASTLDLDSFSGANAAANVGVFGGSTNGSYVPLTIDGTTQRTDGGTTILVPPEEDSANQTFLSSGLYINAVNTSGIGTLVMAQGITSGQSNQGVVVAPGAQISTDISGFDNGGTVALLGTSVDNGGSISTPSGQIILAASPNVFLNEPSGTTTSIGVSTLISNVTQTLVFAGAALAGGSTATNESNGLLSAADGNITILGDVVNQLGVVAATTSVTRAGSLTFTADQQLNFGSASVSSILPDENGETIPGSSSPSFVGPSVTIAAANVDLQGNANGQPGSLIVAPSATMSVSTGLLTNLTGNSNASGRFLQESGSVIDLAGLDAAASIQDYIFTFKVTANDVADTPLAQSLIGQTVTIDLTQSGTRSDGLTWVGSPLFSATGEGYLEQVAQTVDQLLTKGGSLSFTTNSGSNNESPFADVIEAPGSLVNLSGGFIQFTGGKVATTELLTSLGQIVNIADADPFVPVEGIAGQFVVDHPHWVVEQTFTSPLLSNKIFDPGFIAGASAGGLSITAANPILEGALLGATVAGSRQADLAESDTGPNGGQATIDQLPQDASLTISLVTAFGAPASDTVVLQSGTTDVLGADFGMSSTLTLPSLNIVTGESGNGPVTSNVSVLTYSTNALSAADLGSISIGGSSDLSMSRGATLVVQPGGSIKLTGVSTIDGNLTAHGGSISLTGYTGGTQVSSAPPVSQVTIGPDAVLDVSGLFVNDTAATLNNLQGDAHINGGSVAIQTDLESNSTSVAFGGGTNVPPVVDTTQSIVLAQGSVIDLSSGGYVQPNGIVKYGANGLPVGNGGDLSLITYARNAGNNAGWANPGNTNFQGVIPGNVAPNDGNVPDAADVFMDGTIFSAGLNDGGTFTLQAPVIQIGGVNSVTSEAPTGTVVLPATFFSSNGFSAYSLTSTYGSTTVLPGTDVPLRQQNYLDLPAALPATGARVRDFAALGLAPFGMRDPVSLTLAETPYPYGGPNDVSANAGVLIGAGATIDGQPGASITLTAAGPVTVLGRLIAPGGDITLDDDGVPLNSAELAEGQNVGVVTQASLDVWIGADAVIDVDGAFVPNLSNPLLSTGTVLNGGSITLQGGTVIALPGSQFDLTGTSAVIQNFGLVPSLHNSLTEQQIWSNGGTLTIEGSSSLVFGTTGEFQAAYFDGKVDAAGGAPQASGGTLTVGELNGNLIYGAIVVSQKGDVTAALSGQAVPATASQLVTLLPTTNSVVEISENTLNDSGFDSVNLLAGTIGFSGNVSVKVPGQLMLAGNLTLLPAGNPDPSFTAASIGSTVVTVQAGDLTLVSNNLVAPVLSDGTLNLDASAQIDLAGFPSVSNAANVNLTSGGDIRLLSDTDAEFASGIFTTGSGNNIQTYFAQLIQALSNETVESIVQSPGVLAVPDNLNLTAREIYPTSVSAFLLTSTGLGTGSAANTITIASNGETPMTPLSIAGEIVFDAAHIVQDGGLEAPLGTIQLGLGVGQTLPAVFTNNVAFTVPTTVVTQSLVLGDGSLTSVSAAGVDVPFGATINDTDFSTVGANIVADESSGVTNPVLTAPPIKAIQLNGASIDSQSGAVLNLSGGGDFFGTEFVPGSGGSHNVLIETGGQAVYALVPSYEASVAPNDPIQNAMIAPGTSVTLAGGHGVAGGTYVLLPAIYATMPGAFRVVVTNTNTTLTNTDFVEPDGSILVAGTLGNAITGARSSSTALLEIQSQAVWSKYSEIDQTPANTYFANLAATNGTETPLLPMDGGQLVVSATSALTLLGTNDFAPAPGGRGGQADITGTDILVLASDQTAPTADAGFIVLDADQLSDLGATTVLLGGTATFGTSGDTITATAQDLEVDTDAAHPLTGPDLVLVTLASSGADGLTVDAGSVIEAQGSVPGGTDSDLTIGTGTAATASGSLLRVSDGTPVDIIRTGATASGATLVIGTTPGTDALASNGAAATIDGGVSLTLDTSGTSLLATNTSLQAQNFNFSGSVVNLGAVPTGAAGLTISPSLLAAFAGAQSVTLRSASVFNLYDTGGVSLGDANNPIGTLTLDGAGLFSAGGTTTITADNVTLTDSQATPNTAGAIAGSGGTLIVDATADAGGTLGFGGGAMSLNGEGEVDLNAASEIAFAGTGSVNVGAAAATLQAPEIVASAGSVQSLTTTGALDLLVRAGVAPVLSPLDIGGSLSLTGGSINDAGTITALGGDVTLTATSGDLVLAQGANVSATGSHILLFNIDEDAPGGAVKLIATSGNVIVDDGATVDVAGTGTGFAGSLTIQTPKTATIDGALVGDAAFGDLGGNFTLNAGSVGGSLPLGGGFSGSFNVTLQQGDIDIAAGTTLTSDQVTLTANNGSVIVDGTINASNPAGGLIQLFGAGTSTAKAGGPGATGVTIGATAQLIATYQPDDPSDPNFGNGESALVQTGGTIELGTTGTADGTYNAQFGYEDVDGSGAISVAQGAQFDVSGGAGGASINNSGGAVILRAPILNSNNVNLSFQGSVNSGQGGEGVVLDAYAVWSTTDASTSGSTDTVDANQNVTAVVGSQHFDGIVDPAGWFSSAGTKIAGTTNATTGIFTPTGAVNSNHVGFYQTTLVGFVHNPFDSAAIASDFAGASGVVLGSTLHLRPEIDLVNPTPASGTGSINGGNITVASNWNLGAGSFNSSGNFVPVFRTTGGVDSGEPGVLALIASNNVQINATISDGFFEPSDPFTTVTVASTASTLITVTTNFGIASLFDISNGSGASTPGEPGMPGGSVTPPPTVFPASFNVVDQEIYYGEIYQKYLNAVESIGAKNNANVATNPAAAFRTIGASGTVFDNNPADYASYAAYIAAFNANYAGSNNVPGEPAAVTGFVNDPTAAVYGNVYANYLAAYNNYVSALATFSQAYYTAHPTAVLAPPQAPLPPGAFGTSMETSSAGYVSDYQSYVTSYEIYGEEEVEPDNVNQSAGIVHAADSLFLAAMPFLPQPADTPNANISIAQQAAGPANAIANNPAMNGSLADDNTTSAASLMTLAISGQGSFSYNFVAGAQFDASDDLSADPDTVISVPAGVVTTGVAPNDSVTVNGHTSYTNPNKVAIGLGKAITTDVPTLVRTGTGSIDIVAAGSVEMLDTTAPGAIYTAGAAATPVAGFDAPAPALVKSNGYKATGLITDPAWGVDGGSVTIIAGSDIVGIESTSDNSAGSQSGVANMPTSEFWSAWYFVSGDDTGNASAPFNPSQGGIQNSTWINYGTFEQGVGALGGGNVNLKAGADIDDMSASLPETIEVSGGQSAGNPAVAHYFGGGDLTVNAGGNLNSSTFYVGRGAGMINIGGAVQAELDNPVTGTATKLIPITYSGAGAPTLGTGVALPLLIAVQDGFITVTADQSVTLGAVFDPTRLPFDTSKLGNELSVIGNASMPAGVGATFDSFGPDSGVATNSISGDVTLNTLQQQTNTSTAGITNSLFIKVGHNASLGSGSGTDAPPTTGDGGGEPDDIGPASLEASALIGDITLDNSLLLTPSPDGTVDLQAGGSISTIRIIPGESGSAGEFISSITMLDGTASVSTPLFNLLGTPTPATLSQALHIDDTSPAIIYAGGDITGVFDLIKPAEMEAGIDIVNTEFVAQNNDSSNITSVIAGRDIIAEQLLIDGGVVNDSSTFAVYGPGTFLINAGRNLGPFFSGAAANDISIDLPSGITGVHISGIYAVGDGSNFGATKSYLPVAGATVYALFGTGSGVDDQAAIDAFIDPANSANDQGINFLADIATQLGETPNEAWTTFRGLSPIEQGILIDRAFLDELTEVSQGFNDPSSATFQNANQAYETISVLFPASNGFTNDNSSSPVMVHTGDLSMAHSLLETQTGGDINIIGPGGNITVGANATDNSSPSQEGILTLQGGSIRTFTDGSVIVDQSRIFTEQGGDIDMFSANGDLNAGKGPKSSASFPPLELICDVDGFCRVNPTGLVTGAGIGALLSVPGQNPDDSNVSLAAPHGIIDAGAAGIRVAGNLNLVALQVLNAFNIDVGGVAIGIPTASSPNIGALTSATNAAGAAQATLPAPTQHASSQPSILIVEIEGYGGDDEGQPAQAPQSEQRRKETNHAGREEYDPNAPIRLVGYGAADGLNTEGLTQEEKRKLASP